MSTMEKYEGFEQHNKLTTKTTKALTVVALSQCAIALPM